MVEKINAGPFLTETIHNEIRHALKQVHHGRARLVRLPVDEFAKMVEKIMAYGYGLMPFQPMLFDLPVDQTINVFPEIVVVHDDDTNGLVNVKTEMEVL